MLNCEIFIQRLTWTNHFSLQVWTKLPMTWRKAKGTHKRPGPWFNIKMSSYQYRKSHCGDKTISRPSYLHNGISYAGKTTPLYWIKDQSSMSMSYSSFAWKTPNKRSWKPARTFSSPMIILDSFDWNHKWQTLRHNWQTSCNALSRLTLFCHGKRTANQSNYISNINSVNGCMIIHALHIYIYIYIYIRLCHLSKSTHNHSWSYVKESHIDLSLLESAKQ